MAISVAAIVLTGAVATAEEVPVDYKAVRSALGKTTDFKDGVLKVNIRGTICASPSISAERRRRSGSADGSP